MQNCSLLLGGRSGEGVVGVVLVDQVEHDRVTLPHGELSVLVVDKGGDPAVGVERRVLSSLLLRRREIEVSAGGEGVSLADQEERCKG